uniref:Uncharacterized protein n=1 Tax=Opuntia streptacantha TaxID=393608 RepID=A0A7C9DCZ8_OPUST
MLSSCFSFLALLPSSSNAFNLFFIAAILALRLIGPELLLELVDLLVTTDVFDKFSAASTADFSLASRTTKGRPQASLPCIFSFASLASCMLTILCYIGQRQSHAVLLALVPGCAARSPLILSSQMERTSL